MLGKFYKHKEYHTFIKVEYIFEEYARGIGFYRNENDCVGSGDSSFEIKNITNYNEITKSFFNEEFEKVKTEILERIN